MAGAIPPIYPLEIYKGDSLNFFIRARSRTSTGGPGSYYNLTGCTPKAQVRVSEDDSVAVEMTATLGDQETQPGRIDLSLSHAQTTALNNDSYVWDVQVTWPDTRVQTFVRGPVTVIKEVTR